MDPLSTHNVTAAKSLGERGGPVETIARISLGFFLVAAATGAFFRISVALGLLSAGRLVNVRHAHSHLMLFGWVTPLLMALLLQRLPDADAKGRTDRLFAALFVAAAATYPLFLAYGYSPAALLGRRIPLSVIASTANMILWYAFAARYLRRARGQDRSLSAHLAGLAVVFLCVSTVGAWALGLLVPLKVTNPAWQIGLTHFFLDLFSAGWLVPGVLSVAAARMHREGQANRGREAVWLLGATLPFTFAFGMPSAMVPVPLRHLSSAAMVVAGAAFLVLARTIWSRLPLADRSAWRVPLTMFTVMAAIQLASGLVPKIWPADTGGLRILYIHLMLLGFVTLGLIAGTAGFSSRGVAAFTASVVVLLLSLLPLTALWPRTLAGRWVTFAAAVAALLPVIAAGFLFHDQRTRTRRRPLPGASA